jgi:hypothetical protein
MLKIIAIACASIAIFSKVAFTQACCGVSSSLLSAGTPAVKQGTILILTGGDYSTTQNNDITREGFSLGIAYGITDWLNVSLKTNFGWLQSSLFRQGKYDTTIVITLTDTVIVIETILADTTFHYTNYGFGNGDFGTQFIIIPMNAFTKQEIKLGGDCGIPWASTRKKAIVENVEQEMPLKAQNGSGGWSLGWFASYSILFPNIKLTATGNVAGKIKFKNNRGDKPGNDFSTLISLVGGPFWKFHALLTANYKHTGQTSSANGGTIAKLDPLSGGNRFDLLPAISFTPGERLKFTLDAQLPVWRDANQHEIGTRFATRLSVLVYLPVF